MRASTVTLSLKIRKAEVASTILPALKPSFDCGEAFGEAEIGHNYFDLKMVRGMKVADYALERRGGEFFLQVKFSSLLQESVPGCKGYLALLRRFAAQKNLWQTIVYRKGEEVRVCQRERSNRKVKRTGEVRPVNPVTL